MIGILFAILIFTFFSPTFGSAQSSKYADLEDWLTSVSATETIIDTSFVIAISADKKLRIYDKYKKIEIPREKFNLPIEKSPRNLIDTGFNICWLDENDILCGHYSAEHSKFPNRVNQEPLVAPRDLTTDGNDSLCAVSGGDILCWGKMARNRTLDRIKNPKKLFSADRNICAIDANDMIKCANSDNKRYRLLELEKTPVEDVAWSYQVYHFCAITLRERKVICIGDNRWRQAEPDFNRPERLFVDRNNTYMIREGTLSCKGMCNYVEDRKPPVEKVLESKQIFTSYNINCVKSMEGSFACW